MIEITAHTNAKMRAVIAIAGSTLIYWHSVGPMSPARKVCMSKVCTFQGIQMDNLGRFVEYVHSLAPAIVRYCRMPREQEFISGAFYGRLQQLGEMNLGLTVNNALQVSDLLAMTKVKSLAELTKVANSLATRPMQDSEEAVCVTLLETARSIFS